VSCGNGGRGVGGGHELILSVDTAPTISPTISPTTAHFGWSSPMGRRCGFRRRHFGASPARRHGPAWLPKWGHRSSEHHPIGGLLMAGRGEPGLSGRDPARPTACEGR
jgi:hypothetical protein